MKLSGNFAFPTMLQFVAWLSFSVGGGLKIETCKIVDRTTQEEGGGVHSHDNFSPSALSP